MTRERGECGVLGRSAQEDRGDEVEHRMAPCGCEEKTGEQEAHRLRLDGDVRDQDREEAREGRLPEMSGTKTARKPAKAVCVARTRAATLFT